jgi:hypothetical protein
MQGGELMRLLDAGDANEVSRSLMEGEGPLPAAIRLALLMPDGPEGGQVTDLEEDHNHVLALALKLSLNAEMEAASEIPGYEPIILFPLLLSAAAHQSMSLTSVKCGDEPHLQNSIQTASESSADVEADDGIICIRRS